MKKLGKRITRFKHQKVNKPILWVKPKTNPYHLSKYKIKKNKALTKIFIKLNRFKLQKSIQFKIFEGIEERGLRHLEKLTESIKTGSNNKIILNMIDKLINKFTPNLYKKIFKKNILADSLKLFDEQTLEETKLFYENLENDTGGSDRYLLINQKRLRDALAKGHKRSKYILKKYNLKPIKKGAFFKLLKRSEYHLYP